MHYHGAFIDPLIQLTMAVAWQNGPVDYLSNIMFYETELIGQQCWFTENLECFQYANGVDILATDDIHDFMDWGNAETPALYFGIVDGEYSIFYNQALAVENAICPVGWHVPSDGDFMVLESHLGMPNDQLPTYGFGGRYVSDLEGLNASIQLATVC